MSRSDPESREPIAALHLYGPDVPRDVLEMLSVQLELFLEELDRASSDSDAARFTWTTVDPAFQGDRVVVAPTPRSDRTDVRSAKSVLEHARMAISLLFGRPMRPPGFTRLALEHLEWIAGAVEAEGVRRLVFSTGGRAEVFSNATLTNLRTLMESDGSAEEAGSG